MALRLRQEVERTVPPERLTRLDTCIPTPGAAGLQRAMAAVAVLGHEVCKQTAARYSSPRPAALAERVIALLMTDSS